MMKVFDMPQLSTEWFDIKRGKVGASSMAKVMAGGNGKTKKTYMFKLVAEILTNETMETYSNFAMLRGIELEPEARKIYEFIVGCDVEQVGWIEHDNGNIGCSPDGLIGDDGMVEIKCPLPTTQIDYLSRPEGWVPPEYRAQLQTQLWIAERKWVDFFSYCPKIKPLLVRIERDAKKIAELKAVADRFIKEMLALASKYK